MNAQELAKQLRDLAAKEAKAFVNDEANRVDVLKIGEDAAKAILYTATVGYQPIPASWPGAPMEYMAERQKIIADNATQALIVAKAREAHNDAVERLEAKALALGGKLAGGLLSIGLGAFSGLLGGA